MIHRKPDPKIYHYACKEIGIQPNEVIFLDDIGMNLRSANKLGMKTIRKFIYICVKTVHEIMNSFILEVKMGYSEEAVKQLEELTGLDLHTTESKL